MTNQSDDSHKLTVEIQGRDALPVRAIPFVTDWRLQPDKLAQHLSTSLDTPNASILRKCLYAYCIEAKSITKVPPKEWVAIEYKIFAFKTKLAPARPNPKRASPQEYKAWERATSIWKKDILKQPAWKDSASKLPANVFVWLDDFKKDYREHFQANDQELCFSPELSSAEREMVLREFTNDTKRTAIVSSTRTPNWKDWRNLPVVSAWQACLLSIDIDPNSIEPSSQNRITTSCDTLNFEPPTPSSIELKKRFYERLHSHIEHEHDLSHFMHKGGNEPAQHLIYLASFAEWAMLEMKWDDLPSEFATLRAEYTYPSEAESIKIPNNQDQPNEDDFALGFEEDKMIDWDYWIHQLKQINALEASCLMRNLCPKKYGDLDRRQHHQSKTNDILQAQDWLRIAKDHSKTSMTQSEWLAWAESIGRPTRDIFRIKVQKKESTNACAQGMNICKDGSLIVEPPNEKQQVEERRKAGRYTLEEAAKIIAEDTGEREDCMLEKLKVAALNRDLPVYEPGKNAYYKYAPGKGLHDVHELYEEAHWDDLNKWLDAEEKRINFRFPKPPHNKNPSKQNTEPLQRQLSQEQEILRVIKELKYTPTALPKSPSGKRGVKSEVREVLNFKGTIFNKAWERLRDNNEIQDSK